MSATIASEQEEFFLSELLCIHRKTTNSLGKDYESTETGIRLRYNDKIMGLLRYNELFIIYVRVAVCFHTHGCQTDMIMVLRLCLYLHNS